MAEIGVAQADVAAQMGIHASALNNYLNGRRNPPEGFVKRATAALDRLESAERAATEMRAKVLAGAL